MSPDAGFSAHHRWLSLNTATVRKQGDLTEIVLESGEFPVLGPPDAPHLVVVLADYTCPHCRKLHGMLTEARRILLS